VVTIHDLASFHADYMPADFAAMAQRRLEQLGRAGRPDAVIAGTRAVADELADRMPRLAGRIHVTPYGCDHLAEPDTSAVTDGPPFFLFVGNVEKRKNVAGLVRAFELLADDQPEVRLLVVGKPGYGGQEIEAQMASSPVADRMDRRTWLIPDELAAIYAAARGLVFPTWYEGFGFPILEAMWHGCPVITSHNGAMAEVAGEAALLVDPARAEDIAEAMGRLLDDDTLSAELAERGRRHARTFTWDRCAEQTAAVYAGVLGD